MTAEKILTAAFRTGIALAASHLEGAANDGAALAREASYHRDDPRHLYVYRSRDLPAPAIVRAMDGACEAMQTGSRDRAVAVYAWEALAGAYAATQTHRGSPAGRAAVAIVAATLKAHGVDAV